MTTQTEIHYNAEYFAWQRRVGEFTSRANRIKFAEFCSPELNTLDFGCGGGFMLHGLPAKARIGVEINATARKQAAENGLTVFEKAEQAQDDWADLIISDNALEHAHHPLAELRMLFRKMKQEGRAVFVVPCEHLDFDYVPDDFNQHIYSWSPMSIGNLFALAGFEVISSKPFFHKHMPFAHRVRPIVGEKLFNLSCKINGIVNRRKWNEIRVIARKPHVK